MVSKTKKTARVSSRKKDGSWASQGTKTEEPEYYEYDICTMKPGERKKKEELKDHELATEMDVEAMVASGKKQDPKCLETYQPTPELIKRGISESQHVQFAG